MLLKGVFDFKQSVSAQSVFWGWLSAATTPGFSSSVKLDGLQLFLCYWGPSAAVMNRCLFTHSERFDKVSQWFRRYFANTKHHRSPFHACEEETTKMLKGFLHASAALDYCVKTGLDQGSNIQLLQESCCHFLWNLLQQTCSIFVYFCSF